MSRECESRMILSRKRLKELYVEKDISMSKIAQLTGASIGLVHKRIHEEGFVVCKKFGDHNHSRKLNPVEKQRISSLHKGKTVTKESRIKMSEAAKIHTSGHKKIRDDGYVAIYYPDHPDSTGEGYVMEHRLVMEREIGRRISKNEVVHHINHDRSDNRINNLRVMTASDHMSMHMKEKYKNRRNLLCSTK